MKTRLTAKRGEKYILTDGTPEEAFNKLGRLEDLQAKRDSSSNTILLYCIISNSQACYECPNFKHGDTDFAYCSNRLIEKNANGFFIYPQFSKEPLCKRQEYHIVEKYFDIQLMQILSQSLGKTVFLTKEEAEEGFKNMTFL